MLIATTILFALTQQTPPTALPRLVGEIRFDGIVDDVAWGAVQPLPLTLYTPIYRGQATEVTEIRLAYDADNLYAAGKFYDSNADGIRSNSLYRDRWSGDDVFAMFIDSFNDNQSARRFTVNPAGVRIDELLGSDGAERNLSWDTYWDVETTRDSVGWYFEIRIPFSSLRFQETNGETIMGITVSRLIARKNERVTFPDIDPQFPFDQPSVTHDFVLTGITATRPAYFTPYVLSGFDRSRPNVENLLADTERVGEAGGDLKYSINDNVFLDLSANTDFAQVEADDQQINLTRFPLFFPEKRQFFQERSDLFSFTFGNNGGRLFHSRRIGLSEDRDAVRILGGARLAGRLGNWDFGMLNMQSAAYQDQPGENFGVMRVKRRAFNQYSYIGAVATSRIGADSGASVAGGLDTSIRTFGDHYATFTWAATDNGMTSRESLVDRSQFYFAWDRRKDRGLRYWLTVNRVGKAYSPDLGFLARRNFIHPSLYAVFNSRGKEGDLFRSFGPGLILNTFFSNDGLGLETLYLGHWWNYQLWNGASGWLQVTHRYEQVLDAFELGDGVSVPAGDHRFTNVWFNFSSGPSSLFRTTFDFRVGSFYDGSQIELSVRPTWNLSRFLEVGGEYEGNYLRFPDRNTGIDIHLARLRLRAAASTKLSAAALIQYNSVADLVGINLRVRYNLRQGTDFWLVYDEGLNADRFSERFVRQLPLSASRAVRVKITYTLAIGT